MIAVNTRARALQELIQRLDLPSLREIARQAGIQSALRVTCYYRDGAAFNSCATLRCPQEGACALEIVREGWLQQRPVLRSIPRASAEKLNAALGRARFDYLDDQSAARTPRILWLVERAAGVFYHSVQLSPELPEPSYSAIVNALDAYLPEAIRELPR